MSLAAEARAKLRRRPFLHTALRAGVLNYAAAARVLDVGAVEPVTAALRRYAEELPAYESADWDVCVSMRSGVGLVGDGEESDHRDSDASDDHEALFSVGETVIVPDAGSLTGVLAAGEVDAGALVHALARLDIEEIEVVAAGVADELLLVVIKRHDGPDAVRIVEDALETVPRAVTESSTD